MFSSSVIVNLTNRQREWLKKEFDPVIVEERTETRKEGKEEMEEQTETREEREKEKEEEGKKRERELEAQEERWAQEDREDEQRWEELGEKWHRQDQEEERLWEDYEKEYRQRLKEAPFMSKLRITRNFEKRREEREQEKREKEEQRQYISDSRELQNRSIEALRKSARECVREFGEGSAEKPMIIE